MLRFAKMIAAGLRKHSQTVELISPAPVFGGINLFGATVSKWLAYLDKFIIFPAHLLGRAQAFDIVHICDHSNSVYLLALAGKKSVVTCHDLLAVRAGLGENTHVHLQPTGKLLQRLILQGLKRACLVVCDSQATMVDARRLLLGSDSKNKPIICKVPLGLNRPLRKLSPQEVSERLAAIPDLRLDLPYLLHVGSSLPRKNRHGILRIFARLKDKFPGQMVFCGEQLPEQGRRLARETGILDRIIEVVQASDDLLEALYSGAYALIFPSYTEGYGWPIVEAQACGCPVVCSNSSSCPEAAGSGAFLRAPDDEEGFVADILKLADKSIRDELTALGYRNVAQLSELDVARRYLELYRELLAESGRSS